MSPLPAWAPPGSGAWGAAFLKPTLGGAGRDGTAAHSGRASAARADRGRHRTQHRGAGAPGQEPGWGSAPGGDPSAPALPAAGRSSAKSAGCFGDPGLRGAHAASFSHDLTGRAEPGRWAAPPTPSLGRSRCQAGPPPAPSAARPHRSGAGAKPGVPPPRLSPTSRRRPAGAGADPALGSYHVLWGLQACSVPGSPWPRDIEADG